MTNENFFDLICSFLKKSDAIEIKKEKDKIVFISKKKKKIFEWPIK